MHGLPVALRRGTGVLAAGGRLCLERPAAHGCEGLLPTSDIILTTRARTGR